MNADGEKNALKLCLNLIELQSKQLFEYNIL